MTNVHKNVLDESRLAALRDTKLLASPTEESFDRITRLTAKLLAVPVALVSLVDSDHQFFKSCFGLPEPWASERRTPLSHSFCQHVVASENLLAVNDARIHPLVKDNFAVRDIGVVAYLGAPLKTADGFTIGSLCAIDTKPIEWTDDQKQMITDLAAFVATEIESHRAADAAEQSKQLMKEMQIETRLESSVRFLADAMPQIVWTSNSDGNVRYYNQRWFAYTGLNFQQTKNKGWFAVIHPDDLQRCIENVKRTREKGEPHIGEYRLKRGSDGEFRWHLSRSVPCRDETGKIFEWVGTSTDIHDSKMAQAAVERSRDELETCVVQRTEQLTRGHRFIEAVLENVSDGVLACDRQGRITYINPTLQKMVGVIELPHGELPGEWGAANLRVYDPVTRELIPWQQRPMARALRGEIVDGVELLTRPNDTDFRTIVVSVRAMTDADGEIVGAVAASHDITDVRKSQEELLSARRNADAANQAKSDFLANMSHEIRTPITAIVGFSELQLRKDQTPAERDEYVHIVRRNARHLLDLINDILDLSKIEAGHMTIEKIDCDLPKMMAEIMSTMRPRAIERDLKFDIAFEGMIPRSIQTDTVRLRQILTNLLGNAIKFTEKGFVQTSVRFVGNQLHFDVKDSGIGLSPAQMGKLFQSFSQADESTSRRFGGTGLGLTISRRLARLLGGDITVQSAPSIGSTFSVFIDCGSVSQLEMLEQLHEALLPSTVETPVDTQLILGSRLLLAEDGHDNQQLLTTILKSAGAKVSVAENGLVALSMVEQQQFDLVLMDMQMPTLDGYAATNELRRRGYKKPIIALTAHAMAEDRQKCLAVGCSDYLTKPVNVEKLIQMVAHHLELTMPAASPKIEASDTLHSTRRDFPGFTQIIDNYVAGLPARIAEIQSLIAENDLEALRRLVHQLKGSGGGYGFDLITEVAAKAETVMDTTTDRTSIVQQVNSLIDVIRRVEGFDNTTATQHSRTREHA